MAPSPAWRTQKASTASATTRLNGPPSVGVERGQRLGRDVGLRVVERVEHELAARALAGCRAERPAAVQHGRDQPVVVEPHPGPAGQLVEAGRHMRPVGPVAGRRAGGPGAQLVAVGGEEERPGVAGAAQDD
jgi:hypothetical protein